MSLLDDLRTLDLSPVLDAKADLALTVDGDALAGLVDRGAVASVLGDVGVVIATAVSGLEDPEALVEPLTSALADVLAGIGADLPLDDYVEAVTAAARVVADLVAVVSGDPDRIRFGTGPDIGQGLALVGGGFADHAAVVSGHLARFQALVQLVEQGLPTDAGLLVEPALEILLPFATGPVDAARLWAELVAGRLDRVVVDPRLTEGLVAALVQVRATADAGDAAGLRVALATLEEVRTSTVQQLAAALRSVAGVVSGIRLDDAATVVHDVRRVLGGADETVLEMLDGWRRMIADVRETVETIDAAVALAHFDTVLDQVETTARDVVLAGVDGSVEVVKQWLRDLLREIPLRPLRARLSEAIASAAGAVAGADLDAPVEAVRGLLAEVSSVLVDADPAALVQAAVTELEGVVGDALDRIEDALARITAAIEDLAAQAEVLLQRAVTGLRDFREVLDEITAAVEDLGILDAAAEIAATLEDLREQVTDLLANAPVPDALRESVGQLVATLESIDLDTAVGDPLREVAARLQVPPEVATTVRDGLEAVAAAVTSLVPADVLADLEAMVGDALAEIENLDVGGLTAGIGDLLDRAAGVLEEVRFTDLVAPAGEVFDDVVRAVDRVHPRALLRPAIDLYGQILGAVPFPDPQTVAARAGSLTSQAGEAVARTAAEPARRALGPGSGTSGDEVGPLPEDQPPDLRPGDILRLVGFLPARLREALAGLGDGPAGEVLAAIDSRFSDAAAGLRDVRDRVVGLDAAVASVLDTALRPVAGAQVDAQLALSGSAAFAAGDLDLDVSLSLVAAVVPAALELELAGERRIIADRCRGTAAGLTGAVAHDLDLAADLLDAVLPTELLTDVDAFLAALDPEPVADELDALLVAVLDMTPAFLAAAGTQVRALELRVRGLVDTFNPGALMQRYLGVLDVVREELALLDPARLADELGEVHAEVRSALTAYDPRALARELDALLVQAAAAIRGLDPGGLLPDLSGLTAQVARVGQLLPVNALAGVGTQLTAVGEELRALDVQGMLDAVDGLSPEIAEAVTVLITAVRDEIVALLESVRYTSTNSSASVSVGAG